MCIEHHGECHQPHEPHDHHEHERLALPIGQLCCMGACSHPEHQQALANELHAHFAAETLEDDDKSDSKGKKTRKRKALGVYSLSAVTI